ncbi:MAG: hypothetical protein OXC95_15390 [Dehalococcoidia bacterium]|nr:hypothetical protein [Dehalococcoidia bacterium]
MNSSETSRGLADRGIGWQAAGFTIIVLASVVTLELFSGSDFWLYKAFRTAVVQMYWALVVPLGALFDWGRRMFETGKAIREAKLRQIRDEGRQEGIQAGRQEGHQEGRKETIEHVRKLLEESGVSLPSDVAARLYDDQNRNGS